MQPNFCKRFTAILALMTLLLPAAFAAVPQQSAESNPQVISKIEPDYTPEAREARIQGIVALDVEIKSDGNVGDVKVKQSLDKGLDENAVTALRQWKFKPAVRNGAPVTSVATIEVRYALK
jgi:periplasmic protein TonB